MEKDHELFGGLGLGVGQVMELETGRSGKEIVVVLVIFQVPEVMVGLILLVSGE